MVILEATYSVLMWGFLKVGSISIKRTSKDFILEGNLSLLFKKTYIYYYQNQTTSIYYEKSGRKKRNRKWVFYLGKILYSQNYTSNLVLDSNIGKIEKKSGSNYICYKFNKGDVKEACVEFIKIDNFTIPKKIHLKGKIPSMYIKLKNYKIIGAGRDAP
ncbi:MAG TPA: hypothetical protein EYH39_04525 [Desulfurobacteriaceae bacterium]|nr:hypothetical protein [Desulfurobacteriaceae bacterium]